jgi:hypothetical protein
VPDVRALLADPDFRALPKAEQLTGLRELDPEFAGLPYSQQLKALGDPSVPVVSRSEFGKGLASGQQTFGSSLQFLGALTGVDALREWGEALRKGTPEDQAALTPKQPDLLKVRSPGEALDWLGYSVGNLIPSMGASVAGGIAGGAGGVALGGPPGGVVGGIAGAGGISYLLNAGEVYANLIDEGVDEDKARLAASAAGLPMALLDVIVPVKVAGKILWQPVKKAAGKQLAKTLGKEILKNVGEEAGTEAAQEVIGAGAESIVGPKKFWTAETASRTLNSLAAGALGGLVFGGAGEAGGRVRERIFRQPPPPGGGGAPPPGPPPGGPPSGGAPAVPPAAAPAPNPPAGATPGVPTITQKQSAALWARKADLGLGDEPFRAILQKVSGQDSTKALTGPQASQVLDELAKVQPPAAKPAPAGSQWLDRAAEFARSKDRINITALEKHFGIPRAQARQLHAQLVHSGVIDQVGRVVQAQQKLVLPEALEEGAAPAEGAPPAGAAVPGEAAPPSEAGAAASAPTVAPQPSLYDRAEALARKHGKITKAGLKNAFGLRQTQADLLMAQLIDRDVVNPIGKVMQPKVEKPKPPEAKPAVSPPVSPLPSGKPPGEAPPAAPAAPVVPPVVPPVAPAPAAAKPEAEAERLAAAPDLEAQPDEISKPGWSPEPGAIYRNFPVSKIGIDAPRFQYKAGTGAEGVNETLKGVKRFDQEKAGPVHLWHDPATGVDWLINGHQRTNLAKRTGKPGINVHFIKAKDASEARLKGALINIGENNGTSIDAAKIFRETGMGPEEVASADIQLNGPVAREGLALANLAQPLFDRVVSGELPAQRAAVIGAGVKEHADQVALYDRVRQLEKSGKRPTNEQIGEMVRLKPPVKKTKEKLLWGDEEVVQSLIPEKAEVSTYIRNELGSERRLFGTVAKSAAAERLTKRGNVLKEEANVQAAEEANQGLAIYDKLSASAGPINDILDRAAGELAQGGNSHAVKQRAYEEIRSHLLAQAKALTGRGEGAAERAPGLRGEGPDQAGRGEQGSASAQGQLSPPRDLFSDQSGTFDPAAFERAARAGAQKIASGFDKFSTWSREMVKEFGDGVRRYLLRLWRSAQQLHARYRASKAGSERGSVDLFDEGEFAGNREAAASDVAKLERDRLSAEFASPLTRQNLRRKLKRGPQPVQGGLFEAPPEAPRQPGLFGEERGSFSLRALRRQADEYGEFPLPRKQTVFGDAVDALLRPAGGVVSKQGEAGEVLMHFVNEANDAGDVEAGKRLVKLQDSGVTKLSKEDRIQLLDILEGRRSGTPELRRIAMQVRALTDEIGGEAESLGVEISAGGRKVPFVRLANYFPHVIRSVEQLASKFNPVRKDVIDNLVRLGIKPDVASAKLMLDDYLGWQKDGGRRDTLIQYLIDTGQAENRLEATRLLARARKDTTLKHGSLEFAREIDLPFYDPDPGRVLPHWVASATERLESIRVFGQKGAQGDLVQSLIESIRESGGDANYVEKAVERMLGRVNDLQKGQRVSAFLRTVQGFKLGLAAIPNATQGALNSLLYGDLQATAAGFKGILTKEGRRFGMRSGASIDSVLNEMTREVGSEWHPLGVYLKAVGFTGTERLNRIFAANAGANYAGRLAKRLRLNPNDKTTRARIEELGIDPDQVQGGQLTGDQILKAAKKFSDVTQFRSRPQDLPLWASSPVGKLFFQFKTFVYNQARLIGRTTIEEAKRGNFGRASRNLLILATVFPLTGEAIGALRSLMTGRDRDVEGWERYLDDIGQVGALGILSDLFESVQYGGVLKYAAGPAFGQIGEIADAALRIPTAKDPWKSAGAFGKVLLKQVPLAGQLRRRILPGVFPSEEKKKALSPEMRRLLGAAAGGS